MKIWRFLHLAKPVLGIMPEVQAPYGRVDFRERVLWTLAAAVMFCICSNIPLYGIKHGSVADAFFRMRTVLATNRGTLMELGISPIVTSGMLMQLLVGSKLIVVDQSVKEDRALFQGTQKLIGIFITLGQAIAYVMSGMYGDVHDIGISSAILIVVQLFCAGMVVIMLDELLQKGHGLGSGVSLFIAINICETIIWKTFSLSTISGVNGSEYEGALVAFFHLLWTRQNKLLALREALFRSHLPNITNLLATVMIFAAAVYFQSYRIELRVKNAKQRSMFSTYPIKLFYTSNVPIILQVAFVSNIYFISQLLYKKLGSNFFVQMLGRWQEQESLVAGQQIQSIPVGGLVFYISPLQSVLDLILEPIHSVVYITFVLYLCQYFSKTWIKVSGSSSRDVARQFKEQQMVIEGHRGDSVVKLLDRYIPTAAAFGGICIGALTILADMLGAIGSGTGILLAVLIIQQYWETIAREQQSNSFQSMFVR